MSQKVKLNWRYAFGEILLIFIGISLAVSFENWNQQRNKDNIQELILMEIRSDLTQDTLLLSTAISNAEVQMKSIDLMVKYLEEHKPYTDSVSTLLSSILVFPRIQFISAGYQTLKATDITLIENQPLRRDIVKYYEYMHPRVIQTMGDVEFEFKTYWTSWILENIVDFRFGQTAVPLDYSTLQKDPFLIRNLKINKDNISGLYKWLGEAKKSTRSLIQQLNEEVPDEEAKPGFRAQQ